MSLETATPAGGEALPVVDSPAAHIAGGEGPLSPREAARSLIDWRHKRAAQTESAPESAEPAAPEQPELADEANAAPPDEAPGETQEVEPAEELPPIDPPRSWTKDEKERFATLPRETQEYLAAREQERERAVRQSQNEAAEKLKGLTAKEQEAEQLRQQYESALPILLQTLQQTQAGEFSDIRTMADVEKMAAEDWPRYVRWDAQQKKIAAVQQEVRAAQERQAVETHTRFSQYAQEQDKLFIERAPDFADESKRVKLQSAAVETLKSLGFSEEELSKSWNGQERFSLRDHRLQSLILDASRYREAQAQAKKVVAKPVPPVQRPGVAPAKNAGGEALIQNLERQLQNASGQKAMRLAAQLTQARRAAR